VRGKHCDGVAGIIEEGNSVMQEDVDDETMDACLIAAAQRVEHYEMAAYGTLAAWAKAMGSHRGGQSARGNAQRGKGSRREPDVTRGGRHQQSGGFVGSFGEEWRRGGCRSGAGHAQSEESLGSR
jgi:hypothetical protein